MTTVTADELAQYEGKKVIVTRNAEDGTAEEIEGSVQSANALGLLIKPKGKSSVEIIEAGDIIQVAYAPEKQKTLTPKYIKVVSYGNARQHLLDRHGYNLEDINAMSEEDALAFHESIDHEGLGHLHGEKPAKQTDASEAEGDDDSSDEDDAEE